MLSCAAEILISSDTVDFLTKSLGMPYSVPVVAAQQGCPTEMVKTINMFRTAVIDCLLSSSSREKMDRHDRPLLPISSLSHLP